MRTSDNTIGKEKLILCDDCFGGSYACVCLKNHYSYHVDKQKYVCFYFIYVH